VKVNRRLAGIYLKIFLAACFMVVSYLAYSSCLKMEAIFFSETPVDFRQTTPRSIPEDTNRTLHKVLFENSNSYSTLSRLRQLPSKSSQIHYSPVILPFGLLFIHHTDADTNVLEHCMCVCTPYFSQYYKKGKYIGSCYAYCHVY
jgi:hypothetical protein